MAATIPLIRPRKPMYRRNNGRSEMPRHPSRPWAADVPARRERSPPARMIPPLEPPPLTDREREVILGLVRDRAAKAIARELGLAARTVEGYRERVYRKLNIRGVAALTRLALRWGWIGFEEESGDRR